MKIVAVIVVVALIAGIVLMIVRRRQQVIQLDELSKEELYQRAQKAGIQGRSQMTKAELTEALAQAES